MFEKTEKFQFPAHFPEWFLGTVSQNVGKQRKKLAPIENPLIVIFSPFKEYFLYETSRKNEDN